MNYKLCFLLYFLCIAMLQDVAGGERKRNRKKEKEKVEVKEKSAYEKLFGEKHTCVQGLITLHKLEKKLYFELPLNLLNRDMLLATTVSEISDNGDALVGQKTKEPLHVQFTKIDSTIQLRLLASFSITREQDKNIADALTKANIGAILGVYKIEAYNADSTAVVFEISDLFVKRNKLMEPLDDYSANTYGGWFKRNASYQYDRSFLGEIKAFEDNVIVRSHLTYTCNIGNGQGFVEYDKPVTVVATRSIILLPEHPAHSRIGDARVGIFPTVKIKYSNVDNRAVNVFYANRWRVEPSDMEAYKRGELVEPVKPIVFYIDDHFPEMWKKYIRKGIEDWNLAFEKIGFKHAVRVLDFPKDDPDFDPDNIKYSCVRYAPIWMANAMGPSWTDPRTGEIISASVYVYHNLISLLYSWRFVQTAAVDPEVRVPVFPEEVMGDAIRYVARHEVGHCLGFMHNMAASAAFPVEKLRDPEFTQKHGTTPSIMDYARFNYVAQPGDKERGVTLTPPVLGEYDYFLVKWNYQVLPETKTPEEEAKVLSGWVMKHAADPVYRYGKQQIYLRIDPSAIEEDLGDDAMKASAYGIKNLKYIMANLNTWFKDNDEDFSHRYRLYNELIQQYVRYLNHVYATIGGIYLNERYVGDPRPTYKAVPREKQKRALQFLMGELRDMEWLERDELLENFSLIGSPVADLQHEVVNLIVKTTNKLSLCTSKSDKDPYTPEQYMNDIYDYVWKNTLKGTKTGAIDRRLQQALVSTLINKGTGSGLSGGTVLGIRNLALKIQAPEYVKQKSIRDFGIEAMGYREAFDKVQFPGEIAGFGFLTSINFEASPSLAHLYYANLLKTKSLLEKNQNHPSLETRNHYRLLLHQIKKAIKL